MIAKAINTPFEKIRVFQRRLYRAAKENSKRRFGILYDKIYRTDILQYAWLKVRRNAGAHGVDQQTIEQIENEIGVSVLLEDIRGKLMRKAYKPQPVRRVYIPKSGGKLRPLGIPTIADRVVQAAVKIILEPILEADFKDFSYGFRPKRNAQRALKEIYKYINFGCHYVVDADLKSYFDTIPHNKLVLSLQQRIADKAILKLIKLWLKAGVMEGMNIKKELTGTPQGGVISPLLANLYLHWLDAVWERRGFDERKHDAHLVRYADDFVIVCSRNPGYYLQEARAVLNKLGLELNGDKTKIVKVTEEGFDFLGHHFVVQPSKRTMKQRCYYYPSRKAMKCVKEKLREVIQKGQHLSLTSLIQHRVNWVVKLFQDSQCSETFPVH